MLLAEDICRLDFAPTDQVITCPCNVLTKVYKVQFASKKCQAFAKTLGEL